MTGATPMDWRPQYEYMIIYDMISILQSNGFNSQFVLGGGFLNLFHLDQPQLQEPWTVHVSPKPHWSSLEWRHVGSTCVSVSLYLRLSIVIDIIMYIMISNIYITLHKYIRLHYNALQCITLHCIALHCSTLHYMSYKILAHMHTYMHDHTCIHTDAHMYICLHIIYIYDMYIYTAYGLGWGCHLSSFFLYGPASGKKRSFLFGFYRASLQDLFWVSDLLLKIFIYSWFTHWQLWFSIVMLEMVGYL